MRACLEILGILGQKKLAGGGGGTGSPGTSPCYEPTALLFTVSLASKDTGLSEMPKKYISAILGDPEADSGDEGKSKRVGKCGAKKSKLRRLERI